MESWNGTSEPIDPAGTAQMARGTVWRGLARGLKRRCPRCGEGAMFAGYLKPRAECPVCGLALAAFRSDDAPPYFTLLLVGHLVGPWMLLLEQTAHPPLWVHAVLWGPLLVLATLGLLPRIKGAVIGAQWALGIRG